jgi:hypothetical protein
VLIKAEATDASPRVRKEGERFMSTRKNNSFLAIGSALIATLIVAFVALSFSQSNPNAFQQEVALVQSSTTGITAFEGFVEIEDGWSQLIRTEDGIAMELHTYDLEPGGAYTAWWVIFNNPGACSEACGEDDIFIFDAQGNLSPNPEADISILWAAGNVAGASGAATFSAYLAEDRPTGEVVVGQGLQNAVGAEVHLVVRAHGDASVDKLYQQLNSFEPPSALGGVCDICQDVQFAIHQITPVEQVAGN